MRFPVRIRLHRSRVERFFLVALHGLAALTAWLTPWAAAWVSGVLLTILTFSFVWTLTRGKIPECLCLGADGKLQISMAPGQPLIPMELQPGASVHPWLVVVPLRGDHGRKTLLLWPDSASAEELRQMRVWLRWRAGLTAAV